MDDQSSKPLITTVLPTYRRPKLLRKAILSVLNQTYPNFKLCIYDNASGDETTDVVAEIAKEDPRIKYHCHPENIGGVANFNYGMNQVTTPYFSLLSDDNTLLPDFFKEAISILNRYPEAILFAGQEIVVDENGQERGGSFDLWKPGFYSPPDGLLEIAEKRAPTLDGVLFRREVLDSIGLFNGAFNGAVDQDLWMRIARNHTFFVSETAHVLFLDHQTAWSSRRDLREVIGTRRKILEQWYNDPDLSDIMKDQIKKTYKEYIRKEVISSVFQECVYGENQSTLDSAAEIMKTELGFSFKPLCSIIIAKIASQHRYLRKMILASLHTYKQLKNRKQV